jgi:hypothetical protein
MQLDIHLHQRLLHVLDVRRRVLHHAFPMTQDRPQTSERLARTKTGAQQSVLVKLLQPLRIVDVGFASRHVLDVSGVYQQHLKSARLENFIHRYPVDPGRFHRDRLDPRFSEPIRQFAEVRGKAPKRAYRALAAVFADGNYVKRRADVDPGSGWIDGR